MPRVPTIQGPEVAQQALQGRQSVNVTPRSAGQLADSGAAAFAIGRDIEQRTDADTLMRAETDIKSKYLEWEAEAKQRTGQNAWGIAKDAGAWWDENGMKAAEGLTSERQKAMFGQTLAQLKGTSIGQFSGFEAAQRRASVDASTQASIVGTINLAAANPQDTKSLGAAKVDIVKRVGMLSKLNGWPPELAALKEQEYLTNFHKQVIQGLVRDNPAAAQSYFETNKGEIEGSQHAEIGAFAEKATATRLGDTTADEVWQTAGPKSDRDPVALDVMEKQIRDRLKDNDAARQSAIAGLRERAAAFKDARRERDDQLEGSVNQAIMDGKSSREVRNMPAFLSLSPESARKIVTFMENQEFTRIQRGNAAMQREALAEDRADRQKMRTGMADYLRYSSPETLGNMTETQVLNLLPTLGTSLTRDLMEKRRTLANPLKLSEAKIDTDDFNQIAQQMGLRPFAAKTEDEKADLGLLKYRVEQMIASAQQGGKKVLGRDEKLSLMRQEMARTVTTDAGFFSSEKQTPVLAIKPEQIKDVIVPKTDRKLISEAMQKRFNETGDARFAPTEDNLKRWYLKGKSPEAAKLITNAP